MVVTVESPLTLKRSIGARVLYNYMYLKQSNRQEASLRSYTWMASLGMSEIIREDQRVC